MKTKINSKMPIGEILETAGDSVDKVAQILMQSGMGCVGCPMAQMETLEQGAMAHGLKEKQIQEMVNKVNEVLA